MIAALLLLAAPSVAFADGKTTEVTLSPITVNGTSDIWVVNGQSPQPWYGDTAVNTAPVVLALSGVTQIKFSVIGQTANCAGCFSATPDGGAATAVQSGALNGISGLTAPINSLVGVFTATSIASAAPADLTYLTTQKVFSPVLQQAFFIGDGMAGTNSGSDQVFNVPVEAEELWLGSFDAYQWNNNQGTFQVVATETVSQAAAKAVFASSPAPAPLPLLGTGPLSALVLSALSGMGIARRKRNG